MLRGWSMETSALNCACSVVHAHRVQARGCVGVGGLPPCHSCSMWFSREFHIGLQWVAGQRGCPPCRGPPPSLCTLQAVKAGATAVMFGAHPHPPVWWAGVVQPLWPTDVEVTARGFVAFGVVCRTFPGCLAVVWSHPGVHTLLRELHPAGYCARHVLLPPGVQGVPGSALLCSPACVQRCVLSAVG